MGYASLIQLIATVVIKPLLTVGTGLPAIIVVILLEQILWFLGLHGFNIVWGIVSAFWLPLFLQNVAKFAETKSFADISIAPNTMTWLLYTSDAADDLLCVDLDGRRIIKNKTYIAVLTHRPTNNTTN